MASTDNDHICGATKLGDGEPCQYPVSGPDEQCPNHEGDDTVGGRPPHEPDEVTEAVVEALAMQGIPQATIAERLDIHPDTLREHYREILDRGKEAADAQVVQTAFQMAASGENPSMTRFWLKCNADNWVPAEKRKVDASHEHSGEGGGPIMVIDSGDSDG